MTLGIRFIQGSASWQIEELLSILGDSGIKHFHGQRKKEQGMVDRRPWVSRVFVSSLFSYCSGQITHEPQLPGTSSCVRLLKIVMLVFCKVNLQKFTWFPISWCIEQKTKGMHHTFWCYCKVSRCSWVCKDYLVSNDLAILGGSSSVEVRILAQKKCLRVTSMQEWGRCLVTHWAPSVAMYPCQDLQQDHHHQLGKRVKVDRFSGVRHERPGLLGSTWRNTVTHGMPVASP